jgi:MoaA/NifB/PqqE/SkfB family radical SAM enzyme
MSALLRVLRRRYRELRMVARGLLDADHPLLAQIVPTRRCNLACTYCNEYDHVSEPVPLARMRARIDHLAALRTSIVTFSGGEPLLHPDLDEMIRHVRANDMIVGLITNGFLLGPERIAALNAAGLEYLQISIDNVEPDAVSRKSLKSLDRKLQHLAEHAQFEVNVNTVVGASGHSDDALVITRRARSLGFSTSIGILHDEGGQLVPLSAAERDVYDEAIRLGQRTYTRINDFQRALLDGDPNEWHCLAGARYLYICEDGNVHYCSQQRGYPAIPLEAYTVEHLRQARNTEKSCAPYCTVGCVHRASSLDRYAFRRPGQRSQVHLPVVR